MPTTVGAIASSAGALLADPALGMFTVTYQLPFIKMAWSQLQLDWKANGIWDLKKSFALPKIIGAGVTSWVTLAADVPDFIAPIEMYERPSGGTSDQWIIMKERQAEPWEKQVTELEIWYIERNQVFFRGATTARDVLLRYYATLAVLADSASVIPFENVDLYLAFKTAELIAASRGNKARAAELKADADSRLETLIGDRVKDQQNAPARPKPYGWHRRRRYRGV